MTVQTLLWIIVWFWIAIFIGAIIFFAFILGRYSVKDNPQNALVFIKTGKHLNRPIKAKMDGKPTNQGCRYKYGNNVIFVPAKYEETYLLGKRVLYLNRVGQLIASPTKDEEKLSDDEKNNLIYAFCETHFGSDMVHAFKGKATMSIIMVAIIAVIIGAIATFGIIQFQKVAVQKQAATTTQQVTPPTPTINDRVIK